MDLTNYNSLMKNGVVVPYKPEESLLIEKVSSGEMPPDGDSLSKDQLLLISSWIKEGAIKNIATLKPVIESTFPRSGSTEGVYHFENN